MTPDTLHYVILRDDDTNALTPVECLERLYRPFLDRGLPVNLAVIPDVSTAATTPNGSPEGFLTAAHPSRVTHHASSATLPLTTNPPLVRYLLSNPGYHILQHGCHHDPYEFDRLARGQISMLIEQGTAQLCEAGFPRPETFVAPHDKFSRSALKEVAGRFHVISTGWFELRRLPFAWWPKYVFKKFSGAPHWRIGGTLLLSHPGCLLSCQRNYNTMLDSVIHSISAQRLTVLVTHWWEYFRDNRPDQRFISRLHEVASWLAARRDVKVLAFSDLLIGPERLGF
jgi:hypothetical protein